MSHLRCSRPRATLSLIVAFALAFSAGLVSQQSSASAAQRYHVYNNIDVGGGILISNDAGGYYMGRIFPGRGFPGSDFDRQEAWDRNPASNNSDYAWSFVWGSGANYCFWVGPSRGVLNVVASAWATPTGTVADRCT